MISLEQKARIAWRCRRGMLELDLMLQRFTTHHLDTLNDTQVALFEELLTAQDPDLYAWLMGYETPMNKELSQFVAFIQHRNNLL